MQAAAVATPLAVPLTPTATHTLTVADLAVQLDAAGFIQADAMFLADLGITPAALEHARKRLAPHLSSPLRTMTKPVRVAILSLRSKTAPATRLITCSLGERLCAMNWVDARGIHHIHCFDLRDWPALPWHALRHHAHLPSHSRDHADDPDAASIIETATFSFAAPGEKPRIASWFTTATQIFQLQTDGSAAKPVSFPALGELTA